MSKFSIILKCIVAFSLVACGGGSGTKTSGETAAQNPPETTGTGTTTTTTTNTNPPVTDLGKTLAQGSYKKPNVVTTAKEMQPHHFYNVAGYKVCSSGYSANDVNKRNFFVNIVGANETCGSDPKSMFTLILRKQTMLIKSVAPPASGKKIEKGVVFAIKDTGNNRLVAFISEDVQLDRFKF